MESTMTVAAVGRRLVGTLEPHHQGEEQSSCQQIAAGTRTLRVRPAG